MHLNKARTFKLSYFQLLPLSNESPQDLADFPFLIQPQGDLCILHGLKWGSFIW